MIALAAGLVLAQAFTTAPQVPAPLDKGHVEYCATPDATRDRDCALMELWTLCPDLPGYMPLRSWADACVAEIRSKERR